MKNKEFNLYILYIKYNCEFWFGFGGYLLIVVFEEEVKVVEGLNDYLFVEEVEMIYILFVCLFYLYVKFVVECNKYVNGFLKYFYLVKILFIIGIVGSVVVGKSMMVWIL